MVHLLVAVTAIAREMTFIEHLEELRKRILWAVVSVAATFAACWIYAGDLYEIASAPDVIGVKVGAFTDPTFPPPMISGFEEYRFPWVMNVAALPMPGGHHD